MPGLGIGNGIPFKNLNMFPYYYGAIRPCLENLSFWQGLNLYDSNTVENKVEGEANINVQNTSVVYFDGTVNSVCAMSGNEASVVSGGVVYYSLDNITWSKLNYGDSPVQGLFTVIADTLYIGWDGINYFNGYIGLNQWGYDPDSYPVFEFTFAENNLVQNTNRLVEENLQFPAYVVNNYQTINENLVL